MAEISTLAPHPPDRRKRRLRWWWPLASLAAILVVATLPRVIANPPTVETITLVNRTKYALDVDVTSERKDGWTRLGRAERQAPTVVRDVVDHGRTWIFRFASQGFDAGEIRFSKADLTRSGWRVVIPDSVGERLARQGATPTPPPDF